MDKRDTNSVTVYNLEKSKKRYIDHKIQLFGRSAITRYFLGPCDEKDKQFFNCCATSAEKLSYSG